MVSLRFPFSSFPPPNPTSPFPSRRLLTVAGATIATATAVAGIATTTHNHHNSNKHHPFLQNSLLEFILSHLPSSSNNANNGGVPLWGCLSLTSDVGVGPSFTTESKTGASFPTIVKESQALLGVGLRKKAILGLKNINVYAFGVYADKDDVQKNLKEKYEKISASELKEIKDFTKDILENDVNITVRLQIVYSRLSIGSVRNAFEESVGNRLQKFGGPDNKELLQRFTSQFKDETKLPKGSIIELSREHGHVLRTIIDGEEVGSIQSKLLCQSVLDLYIGEDPLDRQAKEQVMNNLASVFENN